MPLAVVLLLETTRLLPVVLFVLFAALFCLSLQSHRHTGVPRRAVPAAFLGIRLSLSSTCPTGGRGRILGH